MNGKSGVGWQLPFILAILSLATLWIALDGRYYWHDIRFLYAASEFSLDQIMAGVFDPHQAWAHIDETSTAGFYASKYLHFVLLKLLLSATADPGTAMQAGTFLSVLLVAITVAISFLLYKHILGSRRQALFCIAALMLAPVIPYLAGKLVSEVPSLPVTALALLLLVKSVNAPGGRGTLLACAAGIFLIIAALIRIDSLFGPAGFCIAASVMPLGNGARRSAIRTSAVAFGVCAAGYFIAAALAGISIEELYRYFTEFTTSGQKPGLISLLGISTFGGVVYLFAVAGLFARRPALAGFLSVWLLTTSGIIILICSRYMVEPRYLVQAVFPLAGLAGLGMDSLYSRVDFSRRFRLAGFAAVLLAIVGMNAVMMRLMPYELVRPALLEAVREIQERDNDAYILVPWAYTDFHFLRLMFPDARIFNVNMARPYMGGPGLLEEWKKRLSGWYGDRFVAGTDRVHEMLAVAPVYYLGWRTYPPLQNVRDFARYVGLASLDKRLDHLGLLNHLEQSAIWDAPDIRLVPAGRSGQYEIFQVENR